MQESKTLEPKKNNSLYTPVIDFLFLGGGSLIFLIILKLLPTDLDSNHLTFFIAVILSYTVNHPHFAYSYQIFYDKFFQKIKSSTMQPFLKIRYAFAGLAVPIIMIVYFSFAIISGSDHLLKWSISAMFFFVGWHYVKQGFGIVMLDAAYKKSFFSKEDKTALLVMTYCTWLASYIFLNAEVSAGSFSGIEYYALDLPESFRVPAQTIVYTFMIGTLLIFSKYIFKYGLAAPINGMIAYFTSVFIWIAAVTTHPFYFALIPAFHSLQYMAVVWRLELNKAASHDKNPFIWLLKFAIVGVILGAIGFQFIPYIMDNSLPKPSELSYLPAFLLSVTIFINIHHYFIDNVIWRKENVDVSQYLFYKR